MKPTGTIGGRSESAGDSAGWAEVEITPPLGLPMDGRGPLLEAGASVSDPLLAQVLVLEDAGGQRLLLASLDVIGLVPGFSAQLRRALAEAAGVPFEAILLNFSHTHSGPLMLWEEYATDLPQPPALPQYERWLRAQMIRAAQTAVERFQPVKITTHRGHSTIGINRRNRDEAGRMRIRPNRDGVCNPDVFVLDVRAATRRCLVFSYGCHPVIVRDFAPSAISADFPGVCRRALKERFGPSLHCQFVQGLAGNVRPRALADFAANSFRAATPADGEAVGRRLANDVIGALENEGRALALKLGVAQAEFVARRDARWLPSSRDFQGREYVRDYWMKRRAPAAASVPWPIGLVRLGADELIAWLASEPVAEWQAHLRGWLGSESLIVWGYCQAFQGYLPTDELLPEGGYEVSDSSLLFKNGPQPFATGLNAAARDGFQALARQLECRRPATEKQGA